MKKRFAEGFSIVEILIVIVVIGLIGTVGWLVYDRQSNKSTDDVTTNTTSSETQNTDSDQETEKTDPMPTDTTDLDQVPISDSIVICSVNPAAESGGGLKVAFYGYIKDVKGYTDMKVWVEYGRDPNNLNQKTAEYTNTSNADNCNELLTSMPADGLSAGKYYYRVVAYIPNGGNIYSKTDSFTKN